MSARTFAVDALCIDLCQIFAAVLAALSIARSSCRRRTFHLNCRWAPLAAHAFANPMATESSSSSMRLHPRWRAYGSRRLLRARACAVALTGAALPHAAAARPPHTLAAAARPAQLASDTRRICMRERLRNLLFLVPPVYVGRRNNCTIHVVNCICVALLTSSWGYNALLCQCHERVCCQLGRTISQQLLPDHLKGGVFLRIMNMVRACVATHVRHMRNVRLEWVCQCRVQSCGRGLQPHTQAITDGQTMLTSTEMSVTTRTRDIDDLLDLRHSLYPHRIRPVVLAPYGRSNRKSLVTPQVVPLKIDAPTSGVVNI
eukprot:6188379-Pleurochrysis_carterae.AAC.1